MRIERRISTVMFFLLLSASLPADEPGRPTRLAIEPNAILRQGQPLEIEVGGIPKGKRARIWVVQDCDGDGRPEDDADCPRIYDGHSEPANFRLVATHRLDFVELDIEFPAA
jgi:hypothetical protein